MRAAATVEDQHVLLLRSLRLVQAIGQRCRRRLVDDAQHIQTSNDTRILCRLALRVIEVGRYSDDCITNRAPQVRLRRRLHLLENRRRDLLREELVALALPLHIDLRLAACIHNLERPQSTLLRYNRV